MENGELYLRLIPGVRVASGRLQSARELFRDVVVVKNGAGLARE